DSRITSTSSGFPRCTGTIRRARGRVCSGDCSYSSPVSFKSCNGRCSSFENQESCSLKSDMMASAKTSPAMKQPPVAHERLAEAYAKARAHLLSQRTPEGFWTGELASSSLSTATAVCALTLVDRRRFAALIGGGVRWLLDHQSDDGGWGDTVKSFSNISTTMLCRAALTLGNEAGVASSELPP